MTEYVVGRVGGDYSEDYTLNGTGTLHLWTTGRTDPWPCVPTASATAACGYERQHDWVVKLQNMYPSLRAFLRDPDACAECCIALSNRHNLPRGPRL